MKKPRAPLALVLAASCLACGPRNAGILVDTSQPAAKPVGLREPEQELADIIKRIERGELPKINFESGSDEITLAYYPTLDAVADLLLGSPQLKLIALAHTDAVGTEAYNLDLSERRAKSVKAYLVQRGVPPPSVRFRGMGFSEPIADNSTDEGRAKNRRVEFRITSRDWDSVY